ncbi:MAG: hypothetical protein KGZ25_08445, partial [Planctomycetes bacterium]|nr:hypothetical protein [Planctomycetota bacterium]
MAEDHDVEKLEEQQDLFTVVIAVFFITIVAALGHGFFAMADRSTGTVGTVVPRVVALYVFPGLMCGYAYGMWGILVGAIVGGVVRMLSLINLGFIIPYFEITEEKHVYMQFSFDKALGATS